MSAGTKAIATARPTEADEDGGEDDDVERNLDLTWDLRRNARDSSSGSAARARASAGERSGGGEHGLLHQQLPEQARPRGAHGGADRQLSGASDRAAQDERPEVDRAEQQDEADRAEQQDQRRTDLARDRILEAADVQRPSPLLRLRQRAPHLGHERGQLA